MDSPRALTRIPLCAKPGCMQCVRDLAITCCRCRIAYYCSRGHQMEDVRRHRTLCANPAPPDPAVPKTPHLRGVWDDRKTVDVVLFPANGLPPQIVSRTCLVRTSTIWHGLKEELLDFGPSLRGCALLFIGVGFIKRTSSYRSRLYLGTRDDHLTSDPVNLCIHRYSNGSDARTWRGDVIGIRCREPMSKYMQHFDVTPDDLSTFETYLRTSRTQPRRSADIPEVVIRQEHVLL
ncbi:hypothetical protein FKP32DRAFT_1599299 [Trametes sanguinea]|nr:hypothetical protein FKP32DRAFT_1599299 [Trametes sanguinea]